MTKVDKDVLGCGTKLCSAWTYVRRICSWYKNIAMKIKVDKNAYFLLDNKVFRNLSGNTGDYKKIQSNWNASLAKKFYFTTDKWNYVHTPFLMLEGAGITMHDGPKINLPDKQTLKNMGPAKLRYYVFEKAYESYKNEDYLKQDQVLKIAKETREKCLKKAGTTVVFDKFIIDGVQDPSFHNSICFALATDYAYRFHSYPSKRKEEIFVSGLLDFFFSLKAGYNVSQFRLVSELGKWLLNKGPKTEENKRILANISLKEWRDLLDTEIVHYAVMGYLENGKMYSVDVFTSDNEQVIRDRIFVYKKSIEHIKMIYKKERLKLPFAPSFGRIHICDNDCNIVSTIEIKKHTKNFSFWYS